MTPMLHLTLQLSTQKTKSHMGKFKMPDRVQYELVSLHPCPQGFLKAKYPGDEGGFTS